MGTASVEARKIQTVTRHLLLITWPFILIVILMLGMIGGTLYLQSALRAYTAGESQWSKGQQDAVFHLNAYAASKSEDDWQRYLDAIAVPLGDQVARRMLEQDEPDLEVARRGLIAGRIHPKDVSGMIHLFRWFRHTPLMQQTVAIWTEGDMQINRLVDLAQQLHDSITTDVENLKAQQALLAEINLVNEQIAPLKAAFSSTLGETSRQLNLLIGFAVSLITLLMLGMGIAVSRNMVKQRVDAHEALLSNRSRLKAMIDASMDAIIEIDHAGNITHWSNQAESMFGWPAYEVIGLPLHMLIIPESLRDTHLRSISRHRSDSSYPITHRRFETRALRRDGSEFPVEITVSSIELQGVSAFCAYVRDITEQRRVAAQLEQLAHYDNITGLPNRVLFQDRLEQEIRLSRRTGLPTVLMFIDIDRFKEVNDTLGHAHGDALLSEAARRLSSCVRATDTVARFGGDEFVVILSQMQDLDSTNRIAERMLELMTAPFHLQNEVAYVSISIGIAVFPTDSDCSETLIKNADQAMYLVKTSGRNNYTYFTRSMQDEAQSRRQLSNDLRNALPAKQLLIHYQPIVHLGSGRIEKAEALLRWQHPAHGLIPPDQFIPIAEETGLIGAIGEWVYLTASEQAVRWKRTHAWPLQLSINQSPSQLIENGPGLVSRCRELHGEQHDHECLLVEITESMLMEARDEISEVLLAYRDASIQIALDDFGTGYSSLSYLSRFDIDYIKIDRSFVSNMTASNEDLSLCEAIVAMAHKLDIKVIAEGVETETQKDLLTRIGCDYAQGYLISPPLPPEEFERMLKEMSVKT
ncbi:MAG TPA: EAL domain-containing protein [Methylophilaceae bacterium]